MEPVTNSFNETSNAYNDSIPHDPTTSLGVTSPSSSNSNVNSQASAPAFHTAAPSKQNPLLKGNNHIVFVGVIAVLALVLLYLLVFSTPQYKFSFNINGVQYYSNEYTPSEFFSGFKDNNVFFVSLDLVDGNADSWSVNSLNLWLVALNYDNKKVHSIVRTIDSSGALKSCMTNDGNILNSKTISDNECSLIMNNNSNPRVLLRFGSQDKVILSANQVEVFSSSKKNSALVNYWVIKQMYPDFDSTLAKINERIGAINST
jgi:hypothetical protein